MLLLCVYVCVRLVGLRPTAAGGGGGGIGDGGVKPSVPATAFSASRLALD